MAAKSVSKKSVQVSASVSPETFQALDDYRWANRLEKTDVLRLAVEEFIVNHDIQVQPETPAE